MNSYHVDVKREEWIFIILIGSGFGFFFGSFSSYLMLSNVNFLHSFAGAVIGFFITLLGSFIVPIVNQIIIPEKSFVMSHFLGALFTFFTGFFGFIIGFTLLDLCCPESIDVIKEPLAVATIVGALSYLIGVILYFFHYHKKQQEMLEKDLIQERLNTLESQLNPHFVHNTLNVLAELVHIDANRAEKGILHLSKMLRTIVDEDSTISVKNELAYVKEYIELVSLQHKDLIELKLTDKTERDLIIPKFAIQLLVENAIKYGFKGKFLTITVEVDDEKITVSNRGEKIEKLKFGYGLSSLEKRAKFLDEKNRLEYCYKEGKNSFTLVLKG